MRRLNELVEDDLDRIDRATDALTHSINKLITLARDHGLYRAIDRSLPARSNPTEPGYYGKIYQSISSRNFSTKSVDASTFVYAVARYDNGKNDGTSLIHINEATVVTVGDIQLRGAALQQFRKHIIDCRNTLLFNPDDRAHAAKLHGTTISVAESEHSESSQPSAEYYLWQSHLMQASTVAENVTLKKYRPSGLFHMSSSEAYQNIDPSNVSLFRSLTGLPLSARHYSQPAFANITSFYNASDKDRLLLPRLEPMSSIEVKTHTHTLDNLYAAIQFSRLSHIQLPIPSSGVALKRNQVAKALQLLHKELHDTKTGIAGAEIHYDSKKTNPKDHSKLERLQTKRMMIDRTKAGCETLMAQYSALAQQLLDHPDSDSTHFDARTMATALGYTDRSHYAGKAALDRAAKLLDLNAASASDESKETTMTDGYEDPYGHGSAFRRL